MNTETPQSAPDNASGAPKPLLMLRGRSASGGKLSTRPVSVMARVGHTQALLGSNGHAAIVRFRTGPVRLHQNNSSPPTFRNSP